MKHYNGYGYEMTVLRSQNAALKAAIRNTPPAQVEIIKPVKGLEVGKRYTAKIETFSKWADVFENGQMVYVPKDSYKLVEG